MVNFVKIAYFTTKHMPYGITVITFLLVIINGQNKIFKILPFPETCKSVGIHNVHLFGDIAFPGSIGSGA